jgi:hypothetical protein
MQSEFENEYRLFQKEYGLTTMSRDDFRASMKDLSDLKMNFDSEFESVGAPIAPFDASDEKAIAADPEVETSDDLLSELDMTSAIEAKSNAETRAALDVADDRSASVVAANAVIETPDDMLADLDMTPALEAESDEEIMRALDSEDDDAPDHPLPIAPEPATADWLTDVRELARKHGPFAPWQIIKIICALNAPADDPAVEASR